MALNLTGFSNCTLLLGLKELIHPVCVSICIACQAGSDGRCAGSGKVLCPQVAASICSSRPDLWLSGIWVLDHHEPSLKISLVLRCYVQQHPSPMVPNCMLWLLDVVHPRPVSTSCCALMYAKQPVELTITNAACPLNKWEEAPWHNKITRERARNRTQMRFHSHKLPLYYTWSIFTIGKSK